MFGNGYEGDCFFSYATLESPLSTLVQFGESLGETCHIPGSTRVLTGYIQTEHLGYETGDDFGIITLSLKDGLGEVVATRS